MKKMNENQLRNLEGGKFWGWDCGPEITLYDGSCIQTCTHYVFWIKNGTETTGCGVH